MIKTLIKKSWLCKKCKKPVTIIYTDKYSDKSDWIALYCKCAFAYKPHITAQEIIFNDTHKPFSIRDVLKMTKNDKDLEAMFENEQFCMIGGG